MESIIYVISVMFIFITFMLLKKSEEKISLIKFGVINIVCLLCYNALVCFILSEFKITITLYLLAIINAVVGAVFLFFIIKDKKIQKYSFKSQDAIAVLVILIATLIISFSNFGLELNIKYMTLDAGNHFGAAREFYEYGTLVDNLENEAVTDCFMTGAYTNTGILFKIFAPFISEINIYRVFIAFDMLTFFLVGIAMYSLIEKLINTRLNFILSMLMIIFFIAGYPCLCHIYGYSYLQVGILIFAIIISVLQYYETDFDKKIIYGILALLNYGLFFTYCIFIPVIYLAELIYIIKKRREINKKLFTKANITIFVVVFLIASLCGIYYFVVPHLLHAQSHNGETFVNLEGYIYRNIWSNFIFLFPIALLCLKKKNDDTYIWGTNLAILIIVMLIYMICMNLFKLSTYYYYKFNFILWLLLWYGAIYAINTLEGKLKTIMKCYISLYMIIGVVVIYNSNVRITYDTYNFNESIKDVYEVFGTNKKIIKDSIYDFNKNHIEGFKFIEDNLKLEKNNTMIIGTTAQQYWILGYFNYKNVADIRVKEYNQEYYFGIDLNKWVDGEYKYLIVLNNYYNYSFYESFYNKLKSGKVIFKNSDCTIYINE